MAMQKELMKSLAKKPVTLRYPFEKLTPPNGFRGKLEWDSEKCVGCGVCVRICPAFALEMVGKGLTAELRYYLSRCAFCAQCVESCPRDALKTTDQYELASYEHVIVEFKRK